MLAFLPDFLIEQFITQYGYLAVFLIIGLESAGLPLPGEITRITGPAGFSALLAGALMTVIGIRYVRHHQRALEDQAELALPVPLEIHHHTRHDCL